MPYCFEFTFTFILVNKKNNKNNGEGVERKEREEMIPPAPPGMCLMLCSPAGSLRASGAYGVGMSPSRSDSRPQPLEIDGCWTHGEPSFILRALAEA